MATSFINFDTKHAVAESTKLKATQIGNIWNIEAKEDIDNGRIVKKGKYLRPEVYQEDTATTFAGKIIEKAANGAYRVEVTAIGDGEGLVLSVPLIYEEYTTKMQEESNFFNAKGDILRVYELYVGDVFTLSADGFDGVPEVNKTVSVSDKKVKVGA